MRVIKKTVAPFAAKVTIGRQFGYTEEIIEKSNVIELIQTIQQNLIKDKNIFLSVSISDTEIVMDGQIEPHLNLSFINYPKFPLTPELLKKEIEMLTKKLMKEFKQNRTIIEYLDETVMLEFSKEIDPRITIPKSAHK